MVDKQLVLKLLSSIITDLLVSHYKLNATEDDFNCFVTLYKVYFACQSTNAVSIPSNLS